MKITLPEYCCPPTFRLHNAGTEGCDHRWQKRESDTVVYWRCTVKGCGARASCEVYD